MSTPCSTFSAPLLRLILCGGGGLPAAWGPLHECGHDYTWDPRTACALSSVGRLHARPPLIDAAGWSLPLDASSPWPARLALVAAWMVVPPTQREYIAAAKIDPTPNGICLRVWLGDGDSINYEWNLRGGCGPCFWRGFLATYSVTPLPTLPAHLALHPPVVTLLLALYDVPEIRARVEAL